MDWSVPIWLTVAGIYALFTGLTFGPWRNLALWTRVHVSIDIATGVAMLLGALALFLTSRGVLRPLAIASGCAAAALGVSLIAGALLGTIPCTGAS